MASTTEIANMALAHLGVGKQISNLETERSEEAIACRAFYDLARDVSLRAARWPFATKITALALIEESPNDEWDYAYRYPTDCLDLRRILSGSRNDSRQSRVQYKIGQDAAGRIVWTDEEEAEFEYTVKTDNPAFYPPDFVLAMSYRLAMLIAPRVTAGDPFSLGEEAAKQYQKAIAQARAASLNEEQVDEDVESEFIRARES